MAQRESLFPVIAVLGALGAVAWGSLAEEPPIETAKRQIQLLGAIHANCPLSLGRRPEAFLDCARHVRKTFAQTTVFITYVSDDDRRRPENMSDGLVYSDLSGLQVLVEEPPLTPEEPSYLALDVPVNWDNAGNPIAQDTVNSEELLAR